MANPRPDGLPSYEEATRGNPNLPRFHRIPCITDKFLTVTNILLAVAIVCVYYIVGLKDAIVVRTIDVARYCNTFELVDNPTPTPGNGTVIACMVLTFIVTNFLIWLAGKYDSYTPGLLLRTVIWKTWIIGIYLVFLLITVDILQYISGVPVPYFFSNQNITDYYCGETKQEQNLPASLAQLDNDLRKSFPSSYSAVYSFCITFMYGYIANFDIQPGLHLTQEIIVLIIGCRLAANQYSAWELGQNHASDILAGAGIGIIYGLMAVRSIFGSMCHSSVTALFETDAQELAPLPEPIDEEENNVLHFRHDRRNVHNEPDEAILVEIDNEDGNNHNAQSDSTLPPSYESAVNINNQEGNPSNVAENSYLLQPRRYESAETVGINEDFDYYTRESNLQLPCYESEESVNIFDYRNEEEDEHHLPPYELQENVNVYELLPCDEPEEGNSNACCSNQATSSATEGNHLLGAIHHVSTETTNWTDSDSQEDNSPTVLETAV